MLDRSEYLNRLSELERMTRNAKAISENDPCFIDGSSYVKELYESIVCSCDYPVIRDFAKIRLRELKDEAKEILSLMKSEVQEVF